MLGDFFGYSISLRYGRNILVRIGFRRLLDSPKFVTIENLFAQHSVSVIFSSRFLVTNLGPVVNILSGLAKISYRKFLFYDIFGELLYILLYAGLGYIFGNQWEAISQISGDATAILVLIIILLILFIVMWRARNGKRNDS